MMSVPSAAETLGISAYALRRAIRSGQIPVVTVGKKVLVDVDSAKVVLAPRAREGVGIAALAQQTGMTVSAIRRGIDEGWLPHWRAGRAYMFDVSTVEEALERRLRTVNSQND